jgi:hypothetical protein
MQLAEAFRQSAPAQVWKLTQRLLSTARRLAHEAAQARFVANFGTPRCNDCEGLRVGKGVVSTCFQVRRCYYDNIKATDLSSKQKAVIEGLVRTRRT